MPTSASAREHMRYLTGFALGDGEEKVAGHSGQFLVGGGRGRGPRRLALHDPGRAARRPDARAGRGVQRPARRAGPSWSRSVGRAAGRRGGRRSCRTRCGSASPTAAPDVELVPVEGWVEADRAVKEPAELERVAAACAVADRALATLLPEIRPGVDRGRPGAPARVADPDRRRRGARLRRRLPVRARGGPAARRPGRPARPSTARSCCSTSAPRSPATGAT